MTKSIDKKESFTNLFYLLLFFITVCVLGIFVYKYYKGGLETFANTIQSMMPGHSNQSGAMIFKAPMSLTKVETDVTSMNTQEPEKAYKNDIEMLQTVLSKIESSRKIIFGNILEFPSFFHAAEKWPGCLPRPLYQGSCGSCWGFAAVTALSSRFYLESCGLSGCKNYPQINFGSMNNVNSNINEIYKFKKLYLTDAINNIDVNKNGLLSLKEWIDIIRDYQVTFSSQASPYIDRHYIAQILVYVLNFQSLGSIDLTNKAIVEERAVDAFNTWISLIKKNSTLDEIDESLKETSMTQPAINEDFIDINALKELWLNEPITLSAEKLISCCNTCMELDYNTEKAAENPVCLGSTLDEAWSILRESGTTTVDCIGYNLDSWTPGSYSPSCKEVQGPLYSFCSGYVIDKSNFQIGDRNDTKSTEWKTDINKLINKYENSGMNPVAIPSTEKNIPWIDPQLFRFRAKNVYKVQNNVKSIQREILERGPVTTGFTIYPDFQYSFGTDGRGGQLYNESVCPLGSSKNSLIYMWNGKDKDKPIGGHAIVIVGWGSYQWRTKSADTGLEISFEVPYWICLNSWGQNWGTSGLSKYSDRKGLPNDMTSGGYFWIVRGLDMCSIENNVIVGQPDIANISYPNVPNRYGWGLPNPSTEDVTFIKQKTDIIDLGSNNFLVYENPVDGGGSYTDRIVKNDAVTWTIESMNPPSPYVLFWGSSRPIYCIGALKKKVSESSTDNVFDVSQETIYALKAIVPVQKNPLLIIDDEQIQLLEILGDSEGIGRIKVVRGVNNSYLSKHIEGSDIKTFPFKGLGTTFLDKITKRCYSKVDVE